jgi:formate dehydrogenase subunit delta
MPGGQTERLVSMANQIALNFGERRDLKQAAERTGEHLQKFWTPAMRAQLAAYAEAGGEGLSPAVDRLFSHPDDLARTHS